MRFSKYSWYKLIEKYDNQLYFETVELNRPVMMIKKRCSVKKVFLEISQN